MLNKVNNKEMVSTQMEDWLILSDHVKYVKHDDGVRDISQVKCKHAKLSPVQRSI